MPTKRVHQKVSDAIERTIELMSYFGNYFGLSMLPCEDKHSFFSSPD